MSQENVEVVKALFAAWENRDPVAALDRIDPDVEVDLTAAIIWGHAEIGHGHAALQRAVAGILEAWEALEFVPESFIDVDPEVIVFLRVKASGRTSGVATQRYGASVYTVRDGRVVRWRVFETLSEAAKAVGI
jgi:ketosteroid isomerase-like protein